MLKSAYIISKIPSCALQKKPKLKFLWRERYRPLKEGARYFTLDADAERKKFL